MTHHNGSALERAVEALGDPARLFTLEQVQFFMAAAQAYGYRRAAEDQAPGRLSFEHGRQVGYRERVAEEEASYPPVPWRLVSSYRQDAREVHRARSRVDERYEREGDWPGGGDDPDECRQRALAAFMWGEGR